MENNQINPIFQGILGDAKPKVDNDRLQKISYMKQIFKQQNFTKADIKQWLKMYNAGQEFWEDSFRLEDFE